MKTLVPAVLATLVALAAIAAVTVLCYAGRLEGETAVALLSAIVGAGVVHATRSTP